MVMICNPKKIPLPDPPYPGPDPGPPDPTDPKPQPQPPEQRAERTAQRMPFPGIAASISGSLAQTLCEAVAHAFSMLAKVESAFVLYAKGEILESEQAYDEAIGHTRGLLASLGNWESVASQRLAWCDLQGIDPEAERSFRAVVHEDVVPMVLQLEVKSGPTAAWDSVARAVQLAGLRGVLTAELENAPQLRALARDTLVSLEHARPAIRRGELFEWLSLRLETSYLEQTAKELLSGLLRLFLIANHSAAVETAAAIKRRAVKQESPKK